MVEKTTADALTDALDTVIKRRRTHKIWSGEPVERATLEALIELAIWAPNHRYTEPWRFFVVQHKRLPGLRDATFAEIDRRVDALETAAAGDAEPAEDEREADAKARAAMQRKLLNKRKKIAQRCDEVGAVVAVAQRQSEDPFVRREDYAATACAIHNMLLGAEARGLGALWSTGDLFLCDTMRPYWGLAAEEQLVGVVFIGHPASKPVPVRHRTAESVTRWI